MRGRHRRRFRSSIFLKLLLVLLATGMVINFIVFAFHRMSERSSSRNLFHRNMMNYAEYIIRDIGNPPSLAKAKDIAERYSVQIRYEGNGSWTTSSSVPKVEEIEKYHRYRKHRHREHGDEDEYKEEREHSHKIRGRRGKFFLLVEKEYGNFILYGDAKRFFNWEEEYTLLLIGLLTFIVAGAYFGIRWVLKPIKWLEEGVAQIADGNLAHRIPVRRRRDELGELAESFNSMAKRVGEMIRSKEQLLLDVSHELRSPITRMKVALELAPDGGKTESIREDLLEMEKMISELLETEKLNSGHGKLELARTDMSALVRETVEGYREIAPGVVFIPPVKAIYADIDADRARLVLKNLFDNAVKYSSHDNGKVEVSAFMESERCVVKVRDFGAGVPKDELPYIFEPFYRADKSRSRKTGGYGLGLSLCKKIMEAHGGDISIISEPGEGTTATIRFQINKIV
ncbi:MAG: HAMP domain-containing histidine kinase [Nitrospinota bacterium]|nr:HAMP domain-containing histidine kinase [Nitrospinota bacterium]